MITDTDEIIKEAASIYDRPLDTGLLVKFGWKIDGDHSWIDGSHDEHLVYKNEQHPNSSIIYDTCFGPTRYYMRVHNGINKPKQPNFPKMYEISNYSDVIYTLNHSQS